MKTNDRLKPDQRSSVTPKYLNPNGNEKWTGRGSTPGWVMNICEWENINIKILNLIHALKHKRCKISIS